MSFVCPIEGTHRGPEPLTSAATLRASTQLLRAGLRRGSAVFVAQGLRIKMVVQQASLCPGYSMPTSRSRG